MCYRLPNLTSVTVKNDLLGVILWTPKSSKGMGLDSVTHIDVKIVSKVWFVLSYTQNTQNNAFEEDFTMGACVCECSICKIHLNRWQIKIILTIDSIYEIVITSELKYKLNIFKHWSDFYHQFSVGTYRLIFCPFKRWGCWNAVTVFQSNPSLG